MPSKWDEFRGKDYIIVDMGRSAIFYIPSLKLKTKIGKETVEQNLERFLKKHIGGFTASTIAKVGFWVDGKKEYYDECREYEASFKGKDRIPILMKKLSLLANVIKEKAIFFKAGQYNCLIKPKRRRPRRK